jgi:hypothetical protein
MDGGQQKEIVSLDYPLCEQIKGWTSRSLFISDLWLDSAGVFL